MDFGRRALAVIKHKNLPLNPLPPLSVSQGRAKLREHTAYLQRVAAIIYANPRQPTIREVDPVARNQLGRIIRTPHLF